MGGREGRGGRIRRSHSGSQARNSWVIRKGLVAGRTLLVLGLQPSRSRAVRKRLLSGRETSDALHWAKQNDSTFSYRRRAGRLFGRRKRMEYSNYGTRRCGEHARPNHAGFLIQFGAGSAWSVNQCIVPDRTGSRHCQLDLNQAPANRPPPCSTTAQLRFDSPRRVSLDAGPGKKE